MPYLRQIDVKASSPQEEFTGHHLIFCIKILLCEFSPGLTLPTAVGLKVTPSLRLAGILTDHTGPLIAVGNFPQPCLRISKDVKQGLVTCYRKHVMIQEENGAVSASLPPSDLVSLN